MKHCILALFIITFSLSLPAQSNDTWFAFWNKDTTLTGYKDKNGIIKIEPKYTGLTNANKFDNIIVVTEEIAGKWYSYYLTKSGKIVGRDSLHIYDNGADCESEGFIRFRDQKTDKAGLFNSNGEIVIPAMYNDLTNVRNGMIIGLKGATKKYIAGGEHYMWTGGKQVIIDTLNHIIIDSFACDHTLNFFSLKKAKEPDTDTTRQSFLATDGLYYSFTDFEKEFKQWLKTNLLLHLTREKLVNASYDTIVSESAGRWAKTGKGQFIKNNFQTLKSGLSALQNPNCDYFIASNGLNPFMFEGEAFEKYYNNCGESKDWIYPVMNIVINHEGKKVLPQNHYTFLRTDNGYKLIYVAIENGQLK